MMVNMKFSISVTDSHDGGNIEFVSQSEPSMMSDKSVAITVTLRIKPDVYTELEKTSHMQYWSFRSFVTGSEALITGSFESIIVKYVIANAKDVSFPTAWPGTTICYTSGSLESCDDDLWKRNLSTDYIDGALTWEHIHTTNGSTFFSYYPPYTYTRHLKLISDCSAQINMKASECSKYNPVIESLGQTLDRREMECLSIGNGKLIAWVQHRQHPGETQAEFFAEGFLYRLFGIDKERTVDDAIEKVLEQYRLYIIPNMCPDGSVRGHIRTNAAGANLNREWCTIPGNNYEAPTMERSPEVLAVLSKMDQTGCDFFLDVHSDEELPYCFFSGAKMTPVWCDRIEHLYGYFVEHYRQHNPDVQKEIGYPPPASVELAMKYMNKATTQVSNRFNCLGLTLELPYKDCATNPDPERGFSIARCKKMGSTLVDALFDVYPYLRAEGEFWSTFSTEDRYIVPRATVDWKSYQ
jgi:murein tripeptide amidase MpaA